VLCQVVEDMVGGAFEPLLEDGGEGDELAEVAVGWRYVAVKALAMAP
jgi:hypothetical protein